MDSKEKDNERIAFVKVTVQDGNGNEVDSAKFTLASSLTLLASAYEGVEEPEGYSLAEWIESTIMSNAEYEKIIAY